MISDSDSASSPKRSFPDMEASTSETTKKLKVEKEDHEDLAARIQQLTKKDRKKYHRAKMLGQRVHVEAGKLTLHPKIHLRHQNSYATFNDIRNLILGILLHDTKLPKGIEIYERQQLSKVVVVDVPMFDPASFDDDDDNDDNNNNNNNNQTTTTTTLNNNDNNNNNNDDDDDNNNTNEDYYYYTLSKSATPARVYNQWIDPTLPYTTFFQHLGIQIDDDTCDKEYDAFGKVASGMCDRRKGLVDRFGQMIQCKLTKSQVKQLRQQQQQQQQQHQQVDGVKETVVVTAEELMLTRQELINDNYPLHSSLVTENDVVGGALPDGWIETPIGQGTGGKKKLLAMDCEMCRSGRRLVLTKVALVDEDHKVVLNEFVMPDCVITDYVTEYSGVDEASLQGVTTTLQDIQQQLLQHIDGDTILVGHGLVNDLRVLKMRHPSIIDTSVIYHHKNGPPYKASLKDLSAMILHRQIQQVNNSNNNNNNNNNNSNLSQQQTHKQKQPLPVVRGHDPCEDAIASMELVQLKMKKGLKFGLHADYLMELMVDRLEHYGKTGVMMMGTSNDFDTVLVKELKDHPRAVVTAAAAAAEKDVVALALEHHTTNDLVFLKLDHDGGGKKNEKEMMEHVKRLYDGLDPHTALIMVAGNYKTDELDRLRKKWYTYKADLKTRPLDEIPDDERWTELDEQRLDGLVELAKRYYIIPSIKI